LSALGDLFVKVKAGDGQVVVLEGEAGIGKSRLVDELVARLQRDGEDLNFLFGSYPPNGAATATGAFSSAYREQFGEEGSAAYLRKTPILVPAFDALLRGESAPEGVEALTKDSLQTCFVNATRALAAERPTVVLIDDLHFGPEEARALFTSLAMAAPGHRVLLIGTTRPGMTEDWQGGLDRFDHVTRIAPQRLGGKDLVRLLEDAFHSKALAESIGVQIIVKSDGNPFFTFEIIRGLREGRFITREDDGTWVTTRVIEEIEIPSSVLDLVNARVAELTEEERDLLDVACCWGFEFDPTLVGGVVGIARIPALKRFGQIERQHRLVRSVGRNYVFDHHQVQEALYGGLNEQLREEYHAALAEALETRTGSADQEPETLDGALCVDLSEHFLTGARGESALRYLEAAEKHLTEGYLHEQAVVLAERALAVPDLMTGPERARALIRLCGVGGPLDRLGRRPRQEECAREAERLAEEAGEPEWRGRAAHSLGWCLDRTARLEEAEAAYRRALEMAVAGGDRKAEALATGSLGSVFQSKGRLAEAREHLERQLELSRKVGYRAGEANATGNLGNVFWLEGRLAEAREHHEQRLALSRETGDRMGEAAAAGNLGLVYQAEGRLAEAREHLERHLALSREIGHRPGEAVAIGNLGNLLQSEGRLAEAQEHFERHLALCREIGYRMGEGIALHNLGLVHSERGETAHAEELLEACLSLCEEFGFRHLSAATLLARGALRVAAGNVESARVSFVAGRDLAANVGISGIETMAHCHLACLPGGDPRDALAAFTENQGCLNAEERLEARWLLFRATGDRAHVVEARRLLDESVAIVDEETRESMLTNRRLSREITAACEGERP
jgi:tetratricopeptide (TPR) repeat protein